MSTLFCFSDLQKFFFTTAVIREVLISLLIFKSIIFLFFCFFSSGINSFSVNIKMTFLAQGHHWNKQRKGVWFITILDLPLIYNPLPSILSLGSKCEDVNDFSVNLFLLVLSFLHQLEIFFSSVGGGIYHFYLLFFTLKLIKF